MVRTGMPYKMMLLLSTWLSVAVSSSFVPGHVIARISGPDAPSRFFSLLIKGGSDDIEKTQTSDSLSPSEVAPAPPSEAITSPDVSSQFPPTSTASLLGPKAPPPGMLRRTFPAFPWHRFPNFLTYVRCLAIPALIGIFFFPERNIEAGLLFAIASFTDWLDGYLARRWDITSAFGAFLDPVADKLMVSTSLILLAGRYGFEVAVPAAIILAREISVSALREWMAQRGQRDLVKVGFQGKVKTALTMVALTVLLLVPTSGAGLLSKLYTPGLVMLYLCAGVTITSGSVYFIAAAPLLLEQS